MQVIDETRVSLHSVLAVVNPASGGVGAGAADEVEALLAERGFVPNLVVLAPGRRAAAVRAAIDAAPDLVVVLGGDGTARLVSELCGPHGPLVAPMPAGTMSKLSRALYGARPWREILADLLQAPSARWVSAGEVDGRIFFCSAVLGSPALWARAREDIRGRRLGRAWRRAVVASQKAFALRVGYAFGGDVGEGLVVRLITPTISRALDPDDAALEAAVLDPNDARAGVRIALNNLVGDWRDDPDVTVRPCVSGRAWACDPIPAMLDGEFCRLGRVVEARFRPNAVRVLAPAA